MTETAFGAELLGATRNWISNGTPDNHDGAFSSLGLPGHVRQHLCQLLTDRSEARLREAVQQPPRGSPAPAVPRVAHRLWLSSPAEPQLPPEIFLKRIARQAANLRTGYELRFWTNADSVSSGISEALGANNITFLNLFEQQELSGLHDPIHRAIEARKFVLAGDIAKFGIIAKFGGIYADIGVIYDPALEIVEKAQVSAMLDRSVFFQPAFMAAPKEHPLFLKWLEILRNPEIMTAVMLVDVKQFTAGHEIWIHGGIGFTAMLFLLLEADSALLPIAPNQGHLHVESTGSWYRPGAKFGNASLSDPTPVQVTHLNAAVHRERVEANKRLAGELILRHRLAPTP